MRPIARLHRLADRRLHALAALALALGVPRAAEAAAQGGCANPPPGPDLVVGAIASVATFGALGGLSAYSLGVSTCNVGGSEASWAANSSAHPVLATNLYRLHDGRFEQLGQSWVKHEFAALAQALCCPCTPSGTAARLGVGCATTSSASLGGAQQQLGPRSEVDPSSGSFPVPFGAQGQSGDTLYKRLQASTAAIDPALFPQARYFAEAQHIAADDAAAGHGANNASWRELTRSGAQSGGAFRLDTTGSTFVGEPALLAWQRAVPAVDVRVVALAGEGHLWVASHTLPLAGGGHRYEYCVFNLDSQRGVQRFSVPIDSSAQISGVGMSFPLAHSGEPYDNAPWTPTVHADRVEWTTGDFATHPNANALRWGTTYSFWFVAASAPGPRTATLGLFRPGPQADPYVGVIGPTGGSPAVTQYCIAAPNSTGALGALDARDFDLGARRMRLFATELPANAAAFSLASLTAGFAANPGGSAGNLCLGGAIGRMVGGSVLSTGTNGALLEAVDLDRIPQPNGLVPVQPGDTWHFQVWHRDSNGGVATSNFTSGVQVQFP